MENLNHTPNSIEMIDITSDNYRNIANSLRDELQTTEWINTTLTGTLTGTLPGVSTAVGKVTATSGTDIAVEGGCSRPAVEWRLVLSAIVYRRTDRRPEGERRPIADIVPVWWEFHTSLVADNERDTSDGDDAPATPGSAPDRQQKGQCPNNFSFTELKPFIIDYE